MSDSDRVWNFDFDPDPFDYLLNFPVPIFFDFDSDIFFLTRVYVWYLSFRFDKKFQCERCIFRVCVLDFRTRIYVSSISDP